ncbi:MAG: hypothetical protein RL328_2204 [Acidobacteriota bacterium]|jgi:Flp pilus assembly protein TadG
MSSSGNPRGERGSALVEFAISFFVVWMIFSGVYSFGYGFYVYNRLETAVAGAALMGAGFDYDSSNTSAYTTAVRNMVLYGDITAGTTPVVPGLTSSNVQVSVGLDANSVPRDVQVSISNYAISAVFRKFTLVNKPRAVARFTGRWLCTGC